MGSAPDYWKLLDLKRIHGDSGEAFYGKIPLAKEMSNGVKNYFWVAMVDSLAERSNALG